MSTAAAEPPVAEPVATEPTPKTSKSFNMPGDLADIVKSAPGNKTIKEKFLAKPEEKKPEGEKPADKKDETKAEEKKDEAPVKTEKEHLSDMRKIIEDKSKTLAERDAELAKLKADFEAAKAAPLPDDVKQQIDRYQKDLAERDQKLSVYDEQLRIAALSRHPKFVAKYDAPIRARMGIMYDVMIANGVDDKTAKSALSAWDESRLAELAESFEKPADKNKFNAAVLGVTELHQQRVSELQDNERAYADLQKHDKEQMEAARKQAFEQNERIGKEVMSEVLALSEEFPKDAELKGNIEKIVGEAAAGKTSTKEILGHMAMNQVLMRTAKAQKAALDAQNTELEELRKKVTDLEKFVTDHGGSQLKGDGGSSPQTAVDKPLWEGFVVKR